jgi:hypothetical protein
MRGLPFDATAKDVVSKLHDWIEIKDNKKNLS